MSFMEKIFGDLNAKEVKKVAKIADKVEAYDEQMQGLTDEQLREKTAEFKERLTKGETLDDILPEAFAVCREASVRSLGMKHFRVQIIGGIVLHQGRIAEMKTGEGKTLVATLPVYLNALEGKGVHVVTVNDYLAKRDMEWMGKLYTFLGLTVGCVIHGISEEERKAAYGADITYGTNNEYGFDYLRDNMVLYKEDMMQRELNFAIVDEVDSILIDEARTPLIISGQGGKSTDMYKTADRFVKGLTVETDFTIEEKDKQVSLTEEGVDKCEQFFNVENFSDPENMEINHHVLQALKARNLMKRDVDYIIKDGEIVIVDEFTGRLMFGRRYSDGLHQAIEAKEGVLVRSESKTLATITLQNYFRMYQKLAGMTGTAKTEEDEFRDIYNMDVVVVPTNMPIVREDLQDAVYSTENGKYKSIVDKVVEAHETGQPVLVGTISIEKSEIIANSLKKRGIKNFNVLNAKHHEQEAEIIAEAGRLGTITIATNMAGRGTDIILGGNPEFEARREMRKMGYSPEAIAFATGFVQTDDPELLKAREEFHRLHDQFKEERKEEQQKVIELGGLCIIGTERHESRRIDNQLRGRSGRQGDPGRTQFCISLEDELMRLFGGEKMQNVVKRLGVEEDEPIEAGMITRSIEGAQKKVEGRNFSIRKYVLQYDNVMNKQREIIYGERKKVLFGEDLREDITSMTHELIDEVVEPITIASRFAEEWDLETLNEGLKKISPNFEPLSFTEDEFLDLNPDNLKELVYDKFEELYQAKEKEIGIEKMREVERMILIRVVDNKWMDHIDAMDQLKSGIGLRALGQQDPAAAYAQEGFDMFELMIQSIKEETVKFCYSVTVQTRTERVDVIGTGEGHKDEYVDDEPMMGGGELPEEEQIPQREKKQEPYRREHPKIGRNDLCPCGSGKKYKNCCGKNA
ncbi:preprotein translocase subunit SecA [Anaerovorax odorimutans]|uniref:Protein translocase subunit SecA n=1 Tax=Anaerovorax odorimutans TaxID=109327 RepID=A0ABT1RQW0_9FIRM|nr:preprotein translocase subunit SecA [Anaerovorax odorimutans]MCQ4637546.1 preprotein translocase subunit SecA [Anaerovorax odorimutans]